MKAFITVLVSLFLTFSLFAQDASTYFPASPGFTWTYKDIPLDSSDNEVDSLTTYQIDSFAVVQTFQGRNANVILSKEGDMSSVVNAPFIDTSYISFEGSDAYVYFELFNVDSVLGSDAAKLSSKLKLGKVKGINNWYSYYRLAEPVNQPYEVFSFDTTIVLDSNAIPVTFKLTGERLNDETIQTDIGSFDCKKFVVDNTVFVSLFNTLIKVFAITDTTWLAPGNGIVRDHSPSTLIDLGGFGAGSFFIPGSHQTVTNPIVTAVNDKPISVYNFNLYQNYPNPFNPSTTIRYKINQNVNVKLKVYNVLGNEVAILVNKEQAAGEYKVQFNPAEINGGLSSGVYFYSLQAGNKSQIRKLVYLK